MRSLKINPAGTIANKTNLFQRKWKKQLQKMQNSMSNPEEASHVLRLFYSFKTVCLILVIEWTKGESKNQHVSKHGGQSEVRRNTYWCNNI